MVTNRQGSSRISAGPWSSAVAEYFDSLIRSKGLTRDKVANEAGISEGRLPQLLSGDKAWYLEDVDILCKYFDLDLGELLDELSIPKSLAI